MELPKHYDAKEAEPKWQRFWDKKGIHKFNPKSKAKIFSIDTPPPTVSGEMHLGHSFSYSQMDFIARYKRMQGFNLFYPFGTDDNGLATERLIEKEKNVKATEMPRQDFIDLCLSTLESIRETYVKDFKAIGLSCDWEIFYTTINEHCRRISQRSFIELYKAGREYRKEAPVMWCPECRTAIAQVELEDKEFSSFFNDIIFKLEDGTNLTIATTRPELLPACVAIFAHPTDERYKHLFGKKAKVPLFDIWVEIMPSEKADPEKGTGILMCCTFGDQDDVEHYKALNLPLRIAITKDGRMTELAGKYNGMKINEARKEIIEDLKKENLLTGQKEITHTVNVHERCGTQTEIIESKQWFIKYLDLKDKFMKAGRELKWHPHHMINRYENWIKGLQWDWCISRQRFSGVPFPVWYCKKCDEVILADESQLPVDPLVNKPLIKNCPKCNSSEFVPEKDILDTWATSSLTPRLAIELYPKEVQEKLYPMSLRPQAHDIITFWLFNTVVKSLLHFNKNPWENVMISGWSLDPHGKKMSKSKGNAIRPQEMIDKYSADALRFWAASTKLGEDNPFQEKELVSGKKFITKIWNASKFSFMHLTDYKKEKPAKLEIIDKWLLTKIDKIIKDSTKYFDNYEYSKIKADVDNFFWNTFCDNYLEIIKDRMYNPDKRGKEAKLSAQFTLYHVLFDIIKLMAPIMPYITEEIYQLFYKEKEKVSSIHVSSWPEGFKKEIDPEAEKAGDIAVDIISTIRKFKSDKDITLKAPVIELIIDCKDEEKKYIEMIEQDIKDAAIVEQIKYKGKADTECSRSDLKLGITLGEVEKK
ncbi:valine--tRNA ligase [Candidatus Woesearchaeota archaeon]|nr:valine--tRNA ligase [Candidatus Woesearchaeota archaeon]